MCLPRATAGMAPFVKGIGYCPKSPMDSSACIIGGGGAVSKFHISWGLVGISQSAGHALLVSTGDPQMLQVNGIPITLGYRNQPFPGPFQIRRRETCEKVFRI